MDALLLLMMIGQPLKGAETHNTVLIGHSGRIGQ